MALVSGPHSEADRSYGKVPRNALGGVKIPVRTHLTSKARLLTGCARVVHIRRDSRSREEIVILGPMCAKCISQFLGILLAFMQVIGQQATSPYVLNRQGSLVAEWES